MTDDCALQLGGRQGTIEVKRANVGITWRIQADAFRRMPAQSKTVSNNKPPPLSLSAPLAILALRLFIVIIGATTVAGRQGIAIEKRFVSAVQMCTPKRLNLA